MDMTLSLDDEHSLTSLSVPTWERCSHLMPRSWFARHRTDISLFLVGIALSLVAGALGAHSPKLGLGFVLCIGLVCAVLARPVFGGFLLIALVPSLSGLEPGLLVPNVRISEVLIGVVGMTILLSTRRIASVRWGLLEWLLLAYGILWAVQGALDAESLGQHLSIGSLGTLIGQLQFFLLYRTVRVTLRTPAQRRTGFTVLLIAAVPMALLAIAQEANVGGLRVWLWQVTGEVTGLQTSGIIRATGLFGNWASLAGLLFPILIVVVAMALGGQLKRMRTVLCLSALLVIGLLLSSEFSVTICLILGVFVLAVQYRQLRKMLAWFAVGMAIALVLVGPVLGNRLNDQFGLTAGSNRSALEPQSIAFRESVWTGQYLPAIARRPLEGYGTVLPDTIQWPDPESQYIALLIEGGYPLLVMYLILLGGMFDHARRAARSDDPFQRALGRGLMWCVLSLLAIGVTWPFASNGGLPQVLWCLFGLAGPAATHFERRGPTSSDSLVSLAGTADR